VAAGLLVVLAAAVAAFWSLQQPFAAPASGDTPCSPQPCATVQGYWLWVSNVKVDAGVVSMQVRFRNSSPATHVDPADLQLRDSQQRSHKLVYDAPGCTRWPRTDFNDGATFGPVPICFRPDSTTPPLTLHWSPDLGFFCCERNIPLSLAA
jgi:hypothetical protein